jgi:transposase
MRQNSMTTKDTAEQAVRDIRRKTRKQYSAEEKIRIVLEGLRGEESIATLARQAAELDTFRGFLDSLNRKPSAALATGGS